MSGPDVPYVTYEFTVIGAVPERMLATFPGMKPERRGRETVLRVGVADRPALMSVLAVIDLFGLSLISLRRLPDAESPAE